MARITQQDLKKAVDYANRMMGKKEGDRLVMDYTMGKPRLQLETGPGVRNVSPRLSMKEMDLFLYGLTQGLNINANEG